MVADRVAKDLGHRDVFVVPAVSSSEENDAGSEPIVRRAGFRVRECTRVPDQFDCFPWAGVESAVVAAPFVVDVRWGYFAAPLWLWDTDQIHYVLWFSPRGSRQWCVGHLISASLRG